MGELEDSQDALLLHVDILAEGIDLPAITGVLPFRDLSKSKLLQTIGRGARLLYEDRMGLYGGDIKPQDYSNMIKPYCWVILSNDLFVDNDQIKKVEKLLYTISNSYNIPLEELTVEGDFRGENEDDLDPVTPRRGKKGIGQKETELTHMIHKLLTSNFIDDLSTMKDSIAFIEEELKKINGKLKDA